MSKKWMGFTMATALVSLTLLAGCGNNANNAGESPAASSPATSSAPADGSASPDAPAGDPTKLVISTWGFSAEFFDAEVFGPFEKAHNVKIVLETGNNADRLNKIRQGTSDIDVVYLSDYYAQQAIDEGLFEKIDPTKIPNIQNIFSIAQAPLGVDYGPAYTVGQLGIAYNPDMVDKEITSWSDLWDPSLKNNLTMPNITGTAGPMVVDAASRVAGNSTFNEDAAFSKLAELKDNVVKFYGQTSEFVNMFAQQEIAGGPIMESYFKDLQAAVPGAKFVKPAEGGYAVMNTLNVVKGSKNKELAEAFIDWQLSKEVQEKSAKAKVDSPVNKDVQLTEEEAKGVTYGAEVIEKLNKLDMAFVNKNIANWTDRWNKEVAN
ncbi:ABC transporter substrate-binding protein [Cohnella lupini]|uniref:Putative spermidine/putrescine transport system substrate-binding protein n=1 Tax=Cohnella lupini TaxID=1294267 RepID=A0A3D9I9W2_9BACL|nr:ABC transporter substrate-binding protein [Cohnella lupini]RED58542.1 putative spermidine/putrescine transport system substrate-binding protein [Cohnella lupini]